MTTNKLITKNDTYALLIAEGVERGFQVIPEFRVRIPEDGQSQEAAERKLERYKSIDLVWVKRLDNTPDLQSCIWPHHWSLVAAFEIEGCNVPKANEFQRHLDDLPKIQTRGKYKTERFVILYTAAYDRRPLNRANIEQDITSRRAKAFEITGNGNTPVHVLSLCEQNWQSQLPR